MAAGANVTRALETAARFAQLAAFVRYERAASVYQWFRGLASSDELASLRLRLSLRVGGSALLAGHLSLALQVAFDIQSDGADFDAIDAYLERRGVADAEQGQSDFYHSILGLDAQYALQEFGRFARDASRAATI